MTCTARISKISEYAPSSTESFSSSLVCISLNISESSCVGREVAKYSSMSEARAACFSAFVFLGIVYIKGDYHPDYHSLEQQGSQSSQSLNLTACWFSQYFLFYIKAWFQIYTIPGSGDQSP